MTLKYESEIIKDIVESRGHEKSSLHYESECVEKWIEETNGAYPKLCDYQSEWLNYINENPIGNFPYEIITDVTEATVNNVVPYAYRSAILKGNTKYRDIDTGDILDTFDESKNLELVSVKLPVLTILDNKVTNIPLSLFENNYTGISGWTGIRCSYPSVKVTARLNNLLLNETSFRIAMNNKPIDLTDFKEKTMTMSNVEWIGFHTIGGTIGQGKIGNLLEYLTTGTLQVKFEIENEKFYPAYDNSSKSNILTVNEDVTLRSNGDVYDELNLLTGCLTQRIDEKNEVLAQAVVKTVDLNIQDQDGNTLGNTLSEIRPIEGTMHIHTDGTPLKPTITMEIPVEATTQNLASFIKGE